MNPQPGRTPQDGALGLTLYNENVEDLAMVQFSGSHDASGRDCRVIKLYL